MIRSGSVGPRTLTSLENGGSSLVLDFNLALLQVKLRLSVYLLMTELSSLGQPHHCVGFKTLSCTDSTDRVLLYHVPFFPLLANSSHMQLNR